jgi:hypothetical protein
VSRSGVNWTVRSASFVIASTLSATDAAGTWATDAKGAGRESLIYSVRCRFGPKSIPRGETVPSIDEGFSTTTCSVSVSVHSFQYSSGEQLSAIVYIDEIA